MSKFIIALYIAATSLALIFLKLGTKNGAPVTYLDNKIQFNITPYAIGGILLYGLSFAIYIYLISRYDLGYIIPLATAFVYVVIFVASYFIFHEIFTATKIAGIALIIAGLMLLNIKG
jgi:drug/metabolite transporter (DMT)-like permease